MVQLPWNLFSFEDPLFAIDDVAGEAAQFDQMRQLWDANARHNPLTSCDFFCGGFAEVFEQNGERIAGFLHRRLELSTASRLLDLGGGIGRIARYLASRVDQYTLAEISPEMLAKARTHLRDLPVQPVLLENSRLPWPEASFSHCIAIDLVPHLPRPVLEAYFVEVARVLVPGGLFLLTTSVAPAPSARSDSQPGRQLLRLLGLKPIPIGAHTASVLAQLIEQDAPLHLHLQGNDFPNQLPMLPVQVPFANCYLLFEKRSVDEAK
ncbi:class I SAM-dependent methyltransferase [Gloeobacter kilaueensis]|uniref:Cyclopropane fatty acyl phospholipid synthase n=1 Tax=Gloeobacter kilaueensis (strain ATCC BAA-2537 / CCAP 1431/1 / ULC 316 / JS1) TaxID=1183438 RepID=U5QR91_GLOK1|nr:class I SAM-dependent methyltransferase [Gloeobacter kilaueensis]AGY60174.1 cyclopropane fatty acyl phospholipid synthase [Gloeobacter kilaueensis JS1]